MGNILYVRYNFFTCLISVGGVVAFSNIMKQSGLKKVFSNTNGKIDAA